MSGKSKASPGQDRLRVFLVDDHSVVRQGIALLIQQQSDMVPCGEAENVGDALAGIKTLRPDVLVTDLSLKNGSGLDLIKSVHDDYPKLPVLVLSMHNEPFYAERAMKAGARGYVTKDERSDRVIEGIRSIARGDLFLDEAIRSHLLGQLIGSPGAPSSGIEGLSDRELQVFEMIGSGLKSQDIAKKLYVTPKTVESYRERIKEKLGLKSASELLQRAIQWAKSHDTH